MYCAPYKYSYLFTYLLTPVHKWLLTLHASSDEQLCNGVASVRLSVCLSVPSINSSSNVQLSWGAEGRYRRTIVMSVSFLTHSFTPTHSFTLGLNPSFSANPPYCSLSFFLIQVSLYGFPRLFSVTSEHIRLFTFSVFTLFLVVGSVR